MRFVSDLRVDVCMLSVPGDISIITFLICDRIMEDLPSAHK